MQSQVKPSHCCKQTPWLAQDSSVQVVLGPGRGRKREHPLLSQAPSRPRSYGSFGTRPEALPHFCRAGRAKNSWGWEWGSSMTAGLGRRQQGGQVT